MSNVGPISQFDFCFLSLVFLSLNFNHRSLLYIIQTLSSISLFCLAVVQSKVCQSLSHLGIHLKEKKKKREKSPLSFPGDSDGKEFVCNLGDLGSIPALGRSPGGGHATHCDSLGWRIRQTEETGGLQSTESQRVGHD